MPLYDIPFGFKGTARTIEEMRKVTIEAARNWRFINVATKIVAGAPARDHTTMARKLLAFVKSYVRFVQDPVTGGGGNLELIQAPFRTLERRAGDCDDLSTLLAALGMAIGIPAVFVTIRADPRALQEFSHVYVAYEIGGKLVGADASVASSVLGWEPKPLAGRRDWRV
jgi:hypothetical protein